MTEALTTRAADIVIIGAGPVGMTLARSLAKGQSAYRVLLVDSRARGSFSGDPRALALSHGTRQLLESLQTWNAAAGTPIHDIHVSQSGGFGRTVITREEQGVAALGYVMRYRDLAAALDATLAPETLLDQCEVGEVRVDADAASVAVRRNGRAENIRARLVVHAEGSPGNEAQVAVRDYRQHAVLAEVRPEAPHRNRAWERFTPEGPLALLPLGSDYSVVFSVPPDKADTLMAMDDSAFLSALQRQFGTRLRFSATSPRARYPLVLRLRQRRCAAREVWIGNTAQTLHPVSGQGFNLGVRDAWELAAALLAHRAADPGAESLLVRYATGRRLDRGGGVAFTDGIVRVFSNDIAPLRFARGLGLMLLDGCPPVRRFVADRMIWGARGW